VHVLDRPARKSGVAFLAIEVAQVCGGEAPQLHVAERGLDVEAGDLFVPLVGVGAHGAADAVREPRVHIGGEF
jgi:hypothetical protein